MVEYTRVIKVLTGFVKLTENVILSLSCVNVDTKHVNWAVKLLEEEYIALVTS